MSTADPTATPPDTRTDDLDSDAEFSAEVARLRARLDLVTQERDAARCDVEELLGGEARPSRRAPDVDPHEAADVTLALCEVYRVAQAEGGARRQRYLTAALRAGDRLADLVLGPAAG